MAEPDKKPKQISDKFNSWKWQVLDGIAADQRVEHADFKFAYRVMQGVNESTREAFITDETICDEISKFDRYACSRSRKRLVEAEWLEIVSRGRSGKATVYRFLDHQVNLFLEQQDYAREGRKERRVERKKRDRRKKSPATDNVRHKPHRNPSDVALDAHSNVAQVQPLHIHSTHSPISLSELNVSSDTTRSWDEEDRWAAFEERAALLEYDGGYVREEAERRAWEEVGHPLQRHAAE